MLRIGKGLAILAGVLVLAAPGGFAYAMLVPPTLLRVATGFSSKLVCSAEFIAHRNPEQVLASDVLSQGNPVLMALFLHSQGRGARRLVHSGFLQFIAPANSVNRMGLGCAAVPDRNLARAEDQSSAPPPGPSPSKALWPEGEGVDLSGHADLTAIVNNDSLAGPGVRAIVVVRDGRIMAERYAPGFDAKTPQIGWSMAKTVTAALTGTVIAAGKLKLDQDRLLPQWAGDGRAKITVAELMSMSPGLRFNEDYGDVSDVTRMLYPRARHGRLRRRPAAGAPAGQPASTIPPARR